MTGLLDRRFYALISPHRVPRHTPPFGTSGNAAGRRMLAVPRVPAGLLLLLVAACAQSLSRAPSIAPSAPGHEAPPPTTSPSAALPQPALSPPFAHWFPSCAPSSAPTAGITQTGTWIVYLLVAQMFVILGYCAYIKVTRRPMCHFAWCAPLAKAMAWACPDKKVVVDNGGALRYPHPAVTPLRHGDGDVAMS